MSAGQRTYFCENGHIVYDTMEDEIFYDDKIEECPDCGSKKIKGVYEWYDEDYHPQISGKIDFTVPHEPIGEDERRCKDHRGNTYYIKINVYDVSRLFQ